jgi:hypothetical protein
MIWEEGTLLRDSLGYYRRCFLRIGAYLADYPEQAMINVAAYNNSSITTANWHQLGDATPHPRRTREWILSRIEEARALADPNDVAAYLDAAKKLGLNAVDQPFWEQFPTYEPDVVIAPDILHGLLRFWRDHILKWVIHLVGNRELDRRVSALQPIVGVRHFSNGISHLSQWTGRDDRELQRCLLAVIARAPNLDGRAIRCLRAFHDFLYLAQYRSHSTTTLGYLSKALNVFHSLKNVFINNGGRRGKKNVINHFRIVKLSALHMYAYHIPLMGTSPQYSTEITETCHQLMAKVAYKATNHRNFVVQMCSFMNRKDRVKLMEELIRWSSVARTKHSIGETLLGHQDDPNFAQGVNGQFIHPQELCITLSPQPGRPHIWHAVRPDYSDIPLNTVANMYRIRNFQEELSTFFTQNSPPFLAESNLLFDTWVRCRIQLPTVQDEDELAETRTVQAFPPGGVHGPYGLCNCVLVRTSENTEAIGIAGNGLRIPTVIIC